jgi:hypothetical protein
MFKADGTPIKNPKRYVASIEKNGYTDPLFDDDGNEIDDPVEFLATMSGGAKANTGEKRKKQSPKANGGDSSSALMFKEDGTQIKNPEKYVASIQKNGYNYPLFTAEGDEIRDPVKFMATRSRDEGPSRKRARVDDAGGGVVVALPPSESLYKADGSMIKNPAGYVAAIERNGYTNPLFTAEGKEINNPTAYLAAAIKRVEPSGGSRTGKVTADVAPPGLYKADGTPIHSPVAYVASIERNGYHDPLYTAEGIEIRNPVAYVAKLESRQGDALVSSSRPKPPSSRPPSSSVSSQVALFKEDGTPIKNPAAYVASVERNGYAYPLFTADGEEIRNPVKYLESKMQSSTAVVPRVPKAAGSALKRLAVPKKRVAPARDSRMRSAPKRTPALAREGSAAERPEGLYKADGSRIKNPSAYVANFEIHGQSQTLFNARGQVVKNPAAYVARMLENEGIRKKTSIAPQRAGGKITYYSRPAKTSSLGQRLKSALTSGMRARAARSQRKRQAQGEEPL